jgi:hypothetical protein
MLAETLLDIQDGRHLLKLFESWGGSKRRILFTNLDLDWFLVGQFRTAGGLVLLSGRKLGPQIFLPLANDMSTGPLTAE